MKVEMQGRTFFRILIDNLFVKNPIGRMIIALVNFCNNLTAYNGKNLKFLKNMPLYNSKVTESSYKKRFIFDSSNSYGVNIK